MSSAVLDASALLALLGKERGWQAAIEHLPGSLVSSVNLSEVVGKLVDAGMTVGEARHMLAGFPCDIVPFDREHAYAAAALRTSTRAFGLSLGDRACLALAFVRGLPAVTAERAWDECEIGVQVIRIR